MNRRIVVPLDGSEAAECALSYAEAIPGDRVALLVCLPSRNEFVGLGTRNQEDQSLWDAIDAYMDRLSGTLIKQGRSVDRLVEIGDPAEVILATAGEDDLIIMTTHGSGAGARAVFGSVADRVVRYSKSPVLVVRGGERPVITAPITRIVVPLDGSDLAEQALTLAMELASSLKVSIRLLRVLDTALLEEAIRTGTYAAAAYADSVDEIRTAFEGYLGERAQELTGKGFMVSTQVLVGPAGQSLLAAAEPGDVVVMTSHGRGGLKRWVLGSVADKLIRGATVPVLITRA